MAQAEHLPIYKASYDLCLYLERVTRSFSRAHKYTLGADLRDGTRRVLKLIVRANARYDKVPLLLEVREEIEARRLRAGHRAGRGDCQAERRLAEKPASGPWPATVASNYWTSSSNANNPANAWNVNFNDGNVNTNNKSNNNFVRAVRGGS